MDIADFESKVSEILSTAETPAYLKALGALESMALAVQRQLGPGAPTVTVEPGYQVAMGQQLNVVVAVPQRNFRDVLFRAYVPATGFPVSLDLYGEEPVRCADEAELEDQVLGFLARPQVRARLAMLGRMALG